MADTAGNEDWMTVSEIAKEVRFSESTVRGWIRGGELPAFSPGRSYRIKRTDWIAFKSNGYQKVKVFDSRTLESQKETA